MLSILWYVVSFVIAAAIRFLVAGLRSKNFHRNSYSIFSATCPFRRTARAVGWWSFYLSHFRLLQNFFAFWQWLITSLARPLFQITNRRDNARFLICSPPKKCVFNKNHRTVLAKLLWNTDLLAKFFFIRRQSRILTPKELLIGSGSTLRIWRLFHWAVCFSEGLWNENCRSN